MAYRVLIPDTEDMDNLSTPEAAWDSESRESPFSTVSNVEDEFCDACGDEHTCEDCNPPQVMIEVKVYAGETLLSQVFDIEDPETAVFAAQTMWDDALRAFCTQGYERTMRAAFTVNDVLVRMVTGRRPS